MTNLGDSKKPNSLLLTERLSERAPLAGGAQNGRPGLRSLMAFPEPTPTTQLSLSKLSAVGSLLQAEAISSAVGETQPPRLQQAAPHLSFFAPTLTALLIRIRQHLEASPQRLLELNPSRRDAICHYLESLAGGSPVTQGGVRGNLSSTEKLRVWADWRNLAPQFQKAITIFFEEVGLLGLAQAILLKAWSDRGLRKWKREDLNDLNAALHGALRPFVPMDREGWQVTRPNLYSWFKLPLEIQESLWSEFSAWRIVDEGPELLVGLIQACRQNTSDRARPVGFDETIYASFWKNTPEPSATLPGASRRISVFSPTLRDGAIVRNGPTKWLWYGWESNPFSLFLSELSVLWWGPSCPPYWSIGTGLETSLNSQLSLNMSLSGKPIAANRIQEMEACDLAWVQEESVTRGAQRSLEAQAFREIADANPSLKRLRTGGTSLGHLQACISISKLRPGGQLWWLRQEPLHASDGTEALQFLLDRGKLVAEWDFSGVSLSFTQTSEKAPLPRYVYLFQREIDVASRLDHHPIRVCTRGNLRSSIEIQPLLDEALKQAFSEQDSASARSGTKLSWQILSQRHPLAQREWADHWPEASETDALEEIQELKRQSRPLASIATIRAGTSSSDLRRQVSGAPSWPNWTPPARGFIIRTSCEGGERKIKTETIPTPSTGGTTINSSDSDAFTLIVADESLVAPLRSYMESEIVRVWLDQKATRKNNKWVLQEQDLRILPVPLKLLSQTLPEAGDVASGFAGPLPGRWEKIAADLPVSPHNVRQALQSLDHDVTGNQIRREIFVRASRILQDVRNSQARVECWVKPSGRIVWRELIGTFPLTDFVAPSVHPGVSIQGQMPLHTPITHQSLLKAPQGILLVTEAGSQVTLGIPNRFLMDVLWDQIQALNKPTWSEIIEFVRAPRRLEALESRAADLLRVHGEQQMLIQQLSSIIAETSSALIR